MWETVYRYFILQGELSLPGIGTFNIERTVTRSDFANRQIHPAIPVIRFTHDQIGVEKAFYQYLSRSHRISEEEAIQQFQDIVHYYQTALVQDGKARLQGIGTLIKEFSNTFSFQPEWDVTDFYRSVPAERIVRRNREPAADEPLAILTGENKTAEKRQVVEGRWLVRALILAIAGIAAIVYFFLTHPANSF